MAYDRHSQADVFRLVDKTSPGLRIRIRRPGLDARILIAEAMPVLRRIEKEPTTLAELRAVKKLCRAFADSVQDWTLQTEGKPTPVTARALSRYDVPFLIGLASAWLREISKPQEQPATPEPEDPEAEAFKDRLANMPMRQLPEEVNESA